MDEETERTRAVVTRYHQYWMDRDIEGVLGMFHPQVQYCDFYNDLEIPASELPAYIRTAMPRSAQHRIEHIDKIRADGDTAFIQYQSRLTLRRSSRLASFRASEAITVRDGLIWRVHEYATPVREQRAEGPGDQQRLGLSSAQVGKMLLDIESYFGSARPYLDPEMDLERLARATGYTRNQISYLLNQVLGQSFYRYLNQARIVHLLERLREEPAARIDELAFAVGFNSLSVFYRCFREHTGQPPRAYLAALASEPKTDDSTD